MEGRALEGGEIRCGSMMCDDEESDSVDFGSPASSSPMRDEPEDSNYNIVEEVRQARQAYEIEFERAGARQVVNYQRVPLPKSSECRFTEGGKRLYPHQDASIRVLERTPGHNLLVVAPTGAGKTIVINSAAKLTRERGQRLFIGEPLIALVEQIYNRLVHEDDGSRIANSDVDMRTGPSVRLTEEAPVITVCTYEVLARICCSDPGQLQGVAWILIDELHFLAGDRGAVIQEIFDRCREYTIPVIGLSGTLGNVDQVASFLCRLNGLPTSIAWTDIRPVQLSFWYYNLLDRGGNFCYLRAQPLADIRDQPDASVLGGLRGRQPLLKLIQNLKNEDCLPALIVNFSCSILDEWASWAGDAFDFLDSRQKAEIIGRFNKLLREIPDEDKQLFEGLRSLAQKGIGIHHSHHPVQYLELVSVLAEKRLLKLVFSTSTLSAGINLPVRTVCLCQARLPKNRSEDGNGFVTIDPLLLRQLAGRAGRPGYETIGNVIIVGRGTEGWIAAAALLAQPLPPILPPDEYNEGDVLRSAIHGRPLALDRASFISPHMSCLAERVKIANSLVTRLRQLLPVGVWEASKTIAKAADELLDQLNSRGDGLMRSPSVILPPVPGEPSVNLFFGLGVRMSVQRGDVVGSEPIWAIKKYTLRASGVGLTDIKAIKPFKVNLQDLEAVSLAKCAVATIVLKSADYIGELLDETVGTVRLMIDAKKALENTPSIAIYRSHEDRLKAAGLLAEDGAPTKLGSAAAHLRSTAHPSLIFSSFLSRGRHVSTEEFITHSSMIIGAGRPDDMPPPEGESAEQTATRSGLLARGAPVTNSAFTAAAHAWTSGISIAEIIATFGVSCGEACRHFVRIADVLTELIAVYDSMGVPPPVELRNAIEKVRRGLPFLRRGGGSR
jgi:hypothetical protein